MTPFNDNMPRTKGEHLSADERSKIQVLMHEGYFHRQIAKALGCAPQTTNDEIKRGAVTQAREQKQNGKTYRYTHPVYFPDVGQRQDEENRLNCGRIPRCLRTDGLQKNKMEDKLTDIKLMTLNHT